MLPPAAADLGEADAAIELWEHYTGKTLDPAQRLVVYVMMAQDAEGKWAAGTTGREMPRQNGKGDEIEVVELWGLVQRGEVIAHTVHEAALLATQAQQRLLGVLEGHADLRRRIKKKWMGVGQQMIELHNGAVIFHRTRSSGGGRGLDDVDRVVVDEAQHATSEQVAAVAPTLFANPNPQVNAIGTGGIENTSRWWWTIRKRALSPDPGAFGYVGHTAEDVYLDDAGNVVQVPVDVYDRSRWITTNPALASGRGSMEFLEEQLRLLGPALFAQEHLCVWCPPPLDGDGEALWQVWSEPEWRACASVEDPGRIGWLDGPVALAVERSPVGPEVTMVVAGECREGVVGVALVAVGRGTSWAVEKLLELTSDPTHPIGRVVIDPKGPAGAMIDRFTEAGIVVTEIPTADYVKATGDFSDAVIDRAIRHRDPEMTEAAKNATTRRVGDAWLLDRRTGMDISPLTAAVLARWGHQQSVDAPADFMAVWT